MQHAKNRARQIAVEDSIRRYIQDPVTIRFRPSADGSSGIYQNDKMNAAWNQLVLAAVCLAIHGLDD
ncbi:hypothetical protein [uncultured Thiocystis sp.]|jgi:hypothetical protein|uniref:hypothetical protein n=1 Tax=uncultured Thiocystis sp. TaxID=1202134 RepID=UPI0025E6D215|nr:hypothetical protein [uncultured Thiocystis sp.]